MLPEKRIHVFLRSSVASKSKEALHDCDFPLDLFV